MIWKAILATIAALAVTGGVLAVVVDHHESPADVARAYVLSATRCGEQGAGRGFDLSVNPVRHWTRAAHVEYEVTHGCAPRPQPALQAFTFAEDGDEARVRVWRGAITPDDARYADFNLIRIDGEWKVDRHTSPDPEDLLP